MTVHPLLDRLLRRRGRRRPAPRPVPGPIPIGRDLAELIDLLHDDVDRAVAGRTAPARPSTSKPPEPTLQATLEHPNGTAELEVLPIGEAFALYATVTHGAGIGRRGLVCSDLFPTTQDAAAWARAEYGLPREAWRLRERTE